MRPGWRPEVVPRAVRVGDELGFHHVEQVPNPLHRRQFLRRQPDAELPLDPHHRAHDIDRVEIQRCAQVLAPVYKLRGAKL